MLTNSITQILSSLLYNKIMFSNLNTRHIFFALSGTFFFALFIILTVLVRADLFTSFDFDTTHRLQNLTPPRLDSFFSSLSVIGRFEYTLVFLVILLILRRKIWGIFVFGLFSFAHVIELIGKTILNHLGPPSMFLRSQYSEFPGLHVYTEASYPSGHSMRSIFLGLLLIFFILQSKKMPPMIKLVLTLGITGLVGVMLYSRVSLGEHWTTDVIGGGLLGISIAFFSMNFLEGGEKST